MRGTKPGAFVASAAMIVLLGLAAGPDRARAAGMVSHAFMADEAIAHVTTPELRIMLSFHHQPLLSGASYPDGGYFAGGYGEISHWERFVDAYAAFLRSKPGCGNLSDPLGPCAPQVAHLLGVAAHGMGDEWWDWLFEPAVTDHGEVPDHPFAPEPLAGVINNIEYAMDTIAIVDYFRWGESGVYLPPPSDLVAIYESIGHSHTEADILAGHAGMEAALAGERVGAIADSERVREQMPWSASHFHGESGGILDTAEAIGGYYEAVWAKLLDDEPPPPRVVAFHPEPGETGVPFRFHPAKTSPGPHTGGAELRILAALSNAVDAGSVDASSFKLLAPDGAEVQPEPGFPRPGPYGHADGTHSLMFYPAADLEPCSVYTALLSADIADWNALTLKPTSWQFRTRSADGKACPAAEDPDPDPGPDPDPDPDRRCVGEKATVAGSAGDDVIKGTNGPDVIVALGGEDVVRGRGGADLICAGPGDDTARGGRGRDVVKGQGGADRITGARARDKLHGNGGGDRIAGGRGDDRLYGGAGEDRCRGGGGADDAHGCERRRGTGATRSR